MSRDLDILVRVQFSAVFPTGVGALRLPTYIGKQKGLWKQLHFKSHSGRDHVSHTARTHSPAEQRSYWKRTWIPPSMDFETSVSKVSWGHIWWSTAFRRSLFLKWGFMMEFFYWPVVHQPQCGAQPQPIDLCAQVKPQAMLTGSQASLRKAFLEWFGVITQR